MYLYEEKNNNFQVYELKEKNQVKLWSVGYLN